MPRQPKNPEDMTREELEDSMKRLEKRNNELYQRTQILKTGVDCFRKIAFTDSTTGLYSGNLLEKDLLQEIGESERTGAPLSIAYADVDNLKELNSKYGHKQVDIFLGMLGNHLNSERSSDRAYRIHGDEIVCILPNTGEEGSVKAVKRLWEGYSLEEIPITFSIGIATRYRKGGKLDMEKEKEQLEIQADNGVEEAKKAGKNRLYHTNTGEYIYLGS